MTNLTNFNSQQLIEQWYQQEQDGVQFPVPFDIAWQIAGYSRKDSAKRALSNYLVEGEDYRNPSQDELHKMWNSSQSKRSEVFLLSCDAMKELCMLSRSEQGKLTRRYFIECEKKWKLVEQYHPEVAEDIEGKRLDQMIRLEELRYQNTKLACDMATMHGKQYAMVVLGRDDQIVEVEKPTIEVIDDRHNVKFKGQTLKQIAEYLTKKTGRKFKNGGEIKRELKRLGLDHLICSTPRSIVSDYVPDENLESVYRALDSGNCQLLLGE
jgi:hypothetical protein